MRAAGGMPDEAGELSGRGCGQTITLVFLFCWFPSRPALRSALRLGWSVVVPLNAKGPGATYILGLATSPMLSPAHWRSVDS